MDLKRIPFINPHNLFHSISLRVSALLTYDGKYLMVINEGDTKYKHPGGHISTNEDLQEALIREVMEETGFDISGKVIQNFVFHQQMTQKGDLLIGAYTQIEMNKEEIDTILTKSPLPSKLLLLSELTDVSTWKSEREVIEYFER